jgi:phage FluMu protein Com
VLEFSWPEVHCFVPQWIFENMGLVEGQRVHIRTVSLQKGEFAKLQPLNPQFYELENLRALLESLLRRFTVLAEGTSFPLFCQKEQLIFKTVEVKPQSVVCIVDTNLEVDFILMQGLEPPGNPSENQPEAVEPVATSWRRVSSGGLSADQDLAVCSNCKAKVSRERLAMHEMVCHRQNVRCARCGKVMKKTDLQQHTEESDAQVKCECGVVEEKYLLPKHKLESCPLRVVCCPFCDLNYTAAELADHQMSVGLARYNVRLASNE